MIYGINLLPPACRSVSIAVSSRPRGRSSARSAGTPYPRSGSRLPRRSPCLRPWPPPLPSGLTTLRHLRGLSPPHLDTRLSVPPLPSPSRCRPERSARSSPRPAANTASTAGPSLLRLRRTVRSVRSPNREDRGTTGPSDRWHGADGANPHLGPVRPRGTGGDRWPRGARRSVRRARAADRDAVQCPVSGGVSGPLLPRVLGVLGGGADSTDPDPRRSSGANVSKMRPDPTCRDPLHYPPRGTQPHRGPRPCLAKRGCPRRLSPGRGDRVFRGGVGRRITSCDSSPGSSRGGRAAKGGRLKICSRRSSQVRILAPA